jgi:hypothetical protein
MFTEELKYSLKYLILNKTKLYSKNLIFFSKMIPPIQTPLVKNIFKLFGLTETKPGIKKKPD